MKKVAVDFKNLTPEVIEAIAKAYPEGFIDSDVISFTNVDIEMEDRVKVILNDKVFLIKKTLIEDAISDKFDDDYFSSLSKGEEDCDAEFCE